MLWVGWGDADGAKGSAEFFAQGNIVLVQGCTGFRRLALAAEDARQYWLDDFVAEKEVGAKGLDSGRVDSVTA